MRKRLSCVLTLYAAMLAGSDSAFCQIEGTGLDLPMYYDPATGDVVIDFTSLPSGRVFGYGVQFSAASFDPAASRLPNLIPENFTPFLGSVWTSADEWSVAETNFSGAPAAVYTLGNVLPPGLSRETGSLIEQRLEGLLPSTYPNTVVGELGMGISHSLDFIYGKSPHAPVNVGGAWTPDHERWAEIALLLYDPTDGGIAIDLTGRNGGAISTFALHFTSDALVNVENWKPAGDRAKGDVGVFKNGGVTESFTSGLDEGYYEMGSLLPPGLSYDELAAQFESARFIGLPGHSGGPFDLELHGSAFALAVVPEPSGVGIVAGALSVLVFVGRRRQG